MAGTNKTVILKMEEDAKKEYVVAVPSKLPNMKVGNTVTFDSEKKPFKVVFDGRWPFKEKRHIVRNNKPLTFSRKGSFTYLCYIGTRPMKLSPTGGWVQSQRIDWTSYESKGGTGSVRPPGK